LFDRNVNEGGYTIKRKTEFNYDTQKAKVQDFKKNTTRFYSIGDVQDMISSFYYLRSQNIEDIKPGDAVSINMFFDSETYPFKMKFLGHEILKTSFGRIKTLKFRPLVQSGRVFKAKESVTIWISADKNKIPILMKASLAVGSLRAELKSFKGLTNSFKVIVD